jgi:hypothetical protein
MGTHRFETGIGEEIVGIDESPRRVSPTVALRELYELLEAYSPMWYTQKAHDLARSALREQTAQ